jgi:TolB protein
MRSFRHAWVALAAAVSVAVVVPVAALATHSGKVGRIAFGVIAADRNTDIYSVMPDGSGQRRLTTAKSFDACAAYSPNGRQIAFCSDRNGKYQVWLMQQDGSGQHQLTQGPYDALFPRYSPDGKRIAYEADDSGPPKVDIYVVGARGGAARRFTGAPGNDVSPSFSPNGKTIAFISGRKGTPQVWLMNGSDGHDQRQLTRDMPAKGERVEWSPDGSLLTYEAGNDIWVIRADGTEPRNLTRSRSIEFGPTWAPDGQEIAFVRKDGAKQRVYVVNADGSHAHPVGGGAGRQLIPSWQTLR